MIKVLASLLGITLVCVSCETNNSWCDLPPDYTSESGIGCAAEMYRYTFNATSKACEMYVYEGCAGTENLFSTEEDCIVAAVKSGCMSIEEPGALPRGTPESEDESPQSEMR